MRYPHFGETKPTEVQDKEEACIKRICKHFGWCLRIFLSGWMLLSGSAKLTGSSISMMMGTTLGL